MKCAKKKNYCRQTRRTGNKVLECDFRQGAPACTEAFLKKHKKLKGSNDMTQVDKSQLDKLRIMQTDKQTKWTGQPIGR